MTIPFGFVQGAKDTAKVARDEAKPTTFSPGAPPTLRQGKIRAAASGLHVVDVLNDGGIATMTISQVRSVPAASYDVDDIVWLIWLPGSSQPSIFAGAGGGGGSEFDFYYQMNQFAGAVVD